MANIKGNKLYTARFAGGIWDKDKKYEMVIVTKWKDRTDESPKEGHKAYYFNANYSDIEELIYDEMWCKRIYAYPQYTRFVIVKEIKCRVE